MKHHVELVECPNCNPWTRVIDHPSTRLPVIECLHESACPTFPHQQRIDGREVVRDER